MSYPGVYADSGLFLCFEGGEGAGKSTQAALLNDWLVARGHDVLLTFEPGDTHVGRDIRRIVLDGGVLVLRELVQVCQTASGPIGTGTWEVDGASSTGIFAGARGSGDDRVDVASRTSTLSGSLNLAEGS